MAFLISDLDFPFKNLAKNSHHTNAKGQLVVGFMVIEDNLVVNSALHLNHRCCKARKSANDFL